MISLFRGPLIRIRRANPGSAGEVARGRIADENGQALVIGLLVILGLSMVAITVANVGMMVAEKIHLQDATDAAAYSAATVEARYMNLSAYVNRAILANYNGMAFNTAMWAVVDAFDHGLAPYISILYAVAFFCNIIPVAGTALAEALDSVAGGLDSTVHKFFHKTNSLMNDWFAQDDDASDFNRYIEIYNTDILSTMNGVLYATIQSARYDVAKQVAKKMDPEVLTTSVLGLGAEAVSHEELKNAVDWIIDDPDERSSPFDTLNSTFNRVFGEEEEDSGDGTDDHMVLLGAVTEASLDRFSAGRKRDGMDNIIRSFNFGNLLPGFAKDALDFFFDGLCIAECIATFGFSGCDCDSDVKIIAGSQMRDGYEDKVSQTHVPFIARRRMREVNQFGIDIQLGGAGAGLPTGILNHTSGEMHNDIDNMQNKLSFSSRMLECLTHPTRCQMNELNQLMAKATSAGAGDLIGSICSLISDVDWFDDHWDGSWDPMPTCGTRYQLGQNFACYVSDVVPYYEKVCSEGFEVGVPKYDWRTDLQNVGFPHFYYDLEDAEDRPEGTTGGGEDNSLGGPSIAIVATKPASKINGLQGLGIGNTYPITAISRAQVYYLRNPNRPNEKPNSFSPYWVSRLAPMDSPDTPGLLSKGLPYVASFGVPIDPTR